MISPPTPRPISGDDGEIEGSPIGDRGTEDTPGVEEIIGHQGRCREPAIVVVAIVNHLDRRHHRRDRAADIGAIIGPGVEVGAELYRDLAFDADVHKVGMREPSFDIVHGGCEHPAGAGIWNIEECLHDRRRAADFVPRQRAVPGGGQVAMKHLLHVVRFR